MGTINSMYKGKLLTFMYQVYKSELPGNMIRLFKSSNCCYDLRNSIKFQVPQFNLEVGRNSLRNRGALFWNSIGDNLKGAPSRNIFKKLLKKNKPLFDNINFNTKMKQYSNQFSTFSLLSYYCIFIFFMYLFSFAYHQQIIYQQVHISFSCFLT